MFTSHSPGGAMRRKPEDRAALNNQGGGRKGRSWHCGRNNAQIFKYYFYFNFPGFKCSGSVRQIYNLVWPNGNPNWVIFFYPIRTANTIWCEVHRYPLLVYSSQLAAKWKSSTDTVSLQTKFNCTELAASQTQLGPNYHLKWYYSSACQVTPV